MRGFVITLSTLVLIVLLVSLTSSLQNSYLSMERALTEPRAMLYAAFLFDAVGNDVNEIAGPVLDIIELNTSMQIYIADEVENNNYSIWLAEYENLIENTMANQTHATVAMNLENISNGTLSMEINSRYNYWNSIPEKKMKFWAQGNTSASVYELNLSAMKERDHISYPSDVPGGDMEITIISTDSNGTVSQTISLSSETSSTCEWAFTDGSYVEIQFGKNDGSNSGALWIIAEDVNATFSFIATVPKINESEKLGYQYDAMMNYSQGKISKNAKIGK
jgi:hypothetical protein